jgi:hypothetical protein
MVPRINNHHDPRYPFNSPGKALVTGRREFEKDFGKVDQIATKLVGTKLRCANGRKAGIFIHIMSVNKPCYSVVTC